MPEELFNGIEDVGDYLDTQEDDVLEIPEEGQGPSKEPDQKPGSETKDQQGQSKQGTDVPEELQDLINTDEDNKESQDEGESEEGVKDDTKDSANETPSSPDDEHDSDDSSPSASVEPYVAFGNTLKDGGSFVTFDEEEYRKLAEEKGAHDAFLELQKKELENAKQEYINTLSDEDRQLYEAKEAGVQLDQVGKIDNAIKSYSSFSDEKLEDEENVDTAKAIVKEYMRLKGFEDDEIDETVDLYEENGSLPKRSVKARDKIVESLKGQKNQLVENSKQEKKKQQDQIEEQKQTLKKTINNFQEVVPGLKLDEQTKQEVYKDMTTPVAEDDQGNPMDALSYQRAKNPHVFDAVIYYYNRLGLMNFDDDGNFKPDFSKITKKAQTKAARELDKVLNNQSNEAFKPNKGSKKSAQTSESLYDGM